MVASHTSPTKEKILREVSASRIAVGRDFSSLRSELDYVSKARSSVKKHPFHWLGGAALAGFLFSGRRKRYTTTPKRRFWFFGKRINKEDAAIATVASGSGKGSTGSWIGLIKILLPILRPAFSAYAAKRLTDFATRVP